MKWMVIALGLGNVRWEIVDEMDGKFFFLLVFLLSCLVGECMNFLIFLVF